MRICDEYQKSKQEKQYLILLQSDGQLDALSDCFFIQTISEIAAATHYNDDAAEQLPSAFYLPSDNQIGKMILTSATMPEVRTQ